MKIFYGKTTLYSLDGDTREAMVCVMLTDGQVFDGVAILHPHEDSDPATGLRIALGRAKYELERYLDSLEE